MINVGPRLKFGAVGLDKGDPLFDRKCTELKRRIKKGFIWQDRKDNVIIHQVCAPEEMEERDDKVYNRAIENGLIPTKLGNLNIEI